MKTIQIQLTNKCTQRCVFCRKYDWKQKELDVNKIKEIFLKYNVANFIFSGGDPLLYSNLKSINKLIKEYDIKYKLITTLSFNLNAEMLTCIKNANEVQVSLDGSSARSYDSIRNPNNKSAFNLLLGNLKKHSESVNFKILTTICKSNIEDIINIYNLTTNLLNVKSRFYFVHTHEEAFPEDKQVDKLINNIQSIKVKNVNTNLFKLEKPSIKECKFIYCNVKNNHRVIDEYGREFTCCYAINDNGVDIGETFEIKNLPDNKQKALLDIKYEYSYCGKCTRYKNANRNWENIKNDSEVYL